MTGVIHTVSNHTNHFFKTYSINNSKDSPWTHIKDTDSVISSGLARGQAGRSHTRGAFVTVGGYEEIDGLTGFHAKLIPINVHF